MPPFSSAISWNASRCSRTPSGLTAFVSFLTVLLLGAAYAGMAAQAPMSATATVVADSALIPLDMLPLPLDSVPESVMMIGGA